MENKKSKGRGSNLTDEDRSRGGRHSAAQQKRDERGRFDGKPRSESIYE